MRGRLRRTQKSKQVSALNVPVGRGRVRLPASVQGQSKFSASRSLFPWPTRGPLRAPAAPPAPGPRTGRRRRAPARAHAARRREPWRGSEEGLDLGVGVLCAQAGPDPGQVQRPARASPGAGVPRARRSSLSRSRRPPGASRDARRAATEIAMDSRGSSRSSSVSGSSSRARPGSRTPPSPSIRRSRRSRSVVRTSSRFSRSTSGRSADALAAPIAVASSSGSRPLGSVEPAPDERSPAARAPGRGPGSP